MKIVYLIRDYINPGGIERVVANKANYLVNHGYEVYIVSLFDKEDLPFFYFDSKITFHSLNLIDDKFINDNFVLKLSSYFNEIKPDIAISTGIGPLNYLYKVKDGSKKILELHFAKYKKKYKLARFDSFLLGRLFTFIYSYKRTAIARKYDAFVVLTDEDRLDWRGLNNITTIPNPLSFVPNSYSDLKTKRVIAIGRYTTQKGFDLLIDIWSKVHPYFPDWKLSFYGVGGKKRKLEDQVKRLNLVTSVELNPPTKDVEGELNKSSIYAMTSRYEGFGLTLLEAMTCGLPAVSFACKSGPRDIINDGEDGFLVSMGDKEGFAQKLLQLMSNTDLRGTMGKAARKNALRFKEDQIMPKWINLFDNLIKD